MVADYAAIDLERERGSEMLSWLRRRRQAERLAQADAEALIRDHGAEAYREARQRERDVILPDGTTHAGRTPAHWRRVALIVARMTGKRRPRYLDSHCGRRRPFTRSKVRRPAGARPILAASPAGRIAAHSLWEVRARSSGMMLVHRRPVAGGLGVGLAGASIDVQRETEAPDAIRQDKQFDASIFTQAWHETSRKRAVGCPL